MIKILLGAVILFVVIGLYVVVSYIHDKKMGKGAGSCDGNCASCGMHTSDCDSKPLK